MIKIGASQMEPSAVHQAVVDISLFQRRILDRMARSNTVFSYDSLQQLHFELVLRANMTDASRRLARSGAVFATFKDSKCNTDFWDLTELGGFQLKEGIAPADAIEDIFVNGRKYAFECATAMVIVLYKAVLDSIDRDSFNKLFANMLLWDWHYDKDLGLVTTKEETYLPGDIRYINNPDYDPKTPEWKGENVVELGGGLYYGHGIGVTTAERIIFFLNRLRKPNATRSAYLMDQATRPNFKNLAKYSKYTNIQSISEMAGHSYILAKIGSATYIYT